MTMPLTMPLTHTAVARAGPVSDRKSHETERLRSNLAAWLQQEAAFESSLTSKAERKRQR